MVCHSPDPPESHPPQISCLEPDLRLVSPFFQTGLHLLTYLQGASSLLGSSPLGLGFPAQCLPPPPSAAAGWQPGMLPCGAGSPGKSWSCPPPTLPDPAPSTQQASSSFMSQSLLLPSAVLVSSFALNLLLHVLSDTTATGLTLIPAH